MDPSNWTGGTDIVVTARLEAKRTKKNADVQPVNWLNGGALLSNGNNSRSILVEDHPDRRACRRLRCCNGRSCDDPNVGAFISHFLTRSREAETNRKLQFRRSLATWKAELGTKHSDNFTTRYPGKVALLRAEVAAVRNDFEEPRRKKFNKLVLDLCSLITEQISHHPNKNPVAQLVSRLTR
jgi:hypothetical protein